jgi:S1-C subfamily serine protease
MAIVLTHLSGGQSGRKEILTKDRIGLGRALDNDVIFTSQDLRASAHHAEIIVNGVEVYIRDLQSTNGTYVNGVKIQQSRLRNGNVIELGRRGPKLLFEMKDPEEASALIHTPWEKGTTLPSSFKVPGDKAGSPSEPSSRRFGQETVQLIVESAVSKSSSRLRWLVVASSVITVITIALVLYFTVFKSDDSASIFAEIAQRNQSAVVLIQLGFDIVDAGGDIVSEDTSEGTGFAIDPQGLIVSNYHTVAPWEYDDDLQQAGGQPRIKWLKVIFADHKMNEGLDAQISRVSKNHDLAILKINPPPRMPVVERRQPDLSQIHQGDEVAFIGFPFGTALLVTTQQEAATTTLRRTTVSKVSDTLIQLDASLQEGFSGSPVFDLRGRVIGVLMAEIGGQQPRPESGAIGLAVPIKHVEQLVK